MKVLQINSVCGTGSTGRIATDLYRVLKEQGHECVIAYGRGSAPNDIDTIKIGSNIDNYTHVFITRIFDKHCFGSTKATKEFIKQVKEFDPDVIHLHNIHGYYINIELLFNYLKEANKPVVWTLHDCWAFTGHCAYFDYIGCEKWKTECNRCLQKGKYPKSMVLDNSKWNHVRKKHIFSLVNKMIIVTPSDWLANLVKKSFLGKYSVKVINNGIDLDIFKPTESDFREKNDLVNKYIILGVASVWDERKGLSSFIELSNRLDENYKIVLVGLTERQQKKLPSKILAITRTNNTNELAEIYTTADVFVNPTLEDNFPTANLESIACGTPVITYATGGSVESVDQSCGAIIEKDNIDELYSAICLVQKKELGFSKCIVKSKQYDKNERYIDYQNYYYKLIGSK